MSDRKFKIGDAIYTKLLTGGAGRVIGFHTPKFEDSGNWYHVDLGKYTFKVVEADLQPYDPEKHGPLPEPAQEEKEAEVVLCAGCGQPIKRAGRVLPDGRQVHGACEGKVKNG